MRFSLSYFEKWALIGILVGAVSGASSIAVYYALRASELLFLKGIAGVSIPVPLGEGGSLSFSYVALRPYLLPIVAALGASLAALVVSLSPEASGNGTDRVIRSFHSEQGRMSGLSWLAKLIGMSLTIGSGGSAGREGPTAFISAGISSNLANALRLTPEDRRRIVAVAMGAGIGTIFKAPIAGALLSAELPYRRDFEHEVIFPSLIASAVGYMIFGAFTGYGPVFGYYIYTFSLKQIPLFAALGVWCGLFAILFVESMERAGRAFARLKAPAPLKAAVGGLLVGVIGYFFPEVLAVGYGWMNLEMYGRFSSLVGPGIGLFALAMLLPFLKILATSLTLGSGGVGGDFAPGIMIGGLAGVSFGLLANGLGFSGSLVPYAVVGMAALFGAAANAPVSVMIMAIEMGGSIELLPPAMIASAISYMIAWGRSLYRSQADTRKDSPAHATEYSTPLLRTIRVEDVKIRNAFVRASSPAPEAIKEVEKEGLMSLPVIDDSGGFLGIVRLPDLAGASFVHERIIRGTPYVRPESTLEDALEAMSAMNSTWVPVVKAGKLIGILTMVDLVDGYRSYLSRKRT